MLANDLGCRLIAEGIEQTEEFDQVYSCGINLVQGFLFSKPGAAQDFSAAWQAPVTTVPVSNRNIAFAKESGV
jgi:EAL domain-containing protein (putative c-di-GMP-specific phosphodiesterase class I)